MNLPAIGDLINQRYRLDAILGAGGFGTVFRATDLQSRGTVAVKVLHPDDGSTYLPATQRRFEREVAILTQLENEHTVRLLSYGSTPSRLFYLVFEHLAGRDLVEVLRDGPLPAPVAEHILRQLLASLAEAHRAGLTHRDIKPANVRVLERDGDAFFVKLLDFGISRSTDRDRMSVTKTGEMIGTPRYMSPEQLRERELTPASDVYSLGMVAVEMLLGDAALLPSSLGAQLERLQSGYLLPAVPNSRLQHVIQRMTASRPQDRYRTAALALRALDGVVEERAPVRSQKRSLSFVIVGVAVLGLLGGILVFVSEPPTPVARPPSARPLNALIATPDLGPAQSRDVAALDVAAVGQPDLPGCYSLGFRGMGTLVSGSYEPAVAYHPPDVQDGGLPLVVFLHGKYDLPGSDELDTYLRASGLIELANEKRFAIVAPRDRWLAAEPWEESEDVEQLKHWVDYMTARGCVDASRVFVVTQSDSSFLSYHLRCTDWVTAMASNGSRTARSETSECGKQTLPSIWVTPRDTDRMPKDGGTRCRGVGGNDLQRMVSGRRGSSLSLVEFQDMLKSQHKCRGEPRAVYRQGRYGTCIEWTCGTPLRICTHSGGEPWPGTTTIDACAGEASEFAVGEQIWSFFETVPALKPK